MAKFNSTAGVLFMEGTHVIKGNTEKSVLVVLQNVLDIKFKPSFERGGVSHYEVKIYYSNSEAERHLLITEKEYDDIQKLIGGR